MDVLNRLVILTLALLAAGCEFIREPTPLGLTGEQVMVHSLLVAKSETVHVLLTRVRPGSGTSDPSTRPLSGADVRIVNGGDTLRLREAPPGFPPCFSPSRFAEPRVDSIGPGCYAAVIPGGIRADGRYELRVSLAGGEPIRGVADVPGEPLIEAPEADARFRVRFGEADFNQGVVNVPVRWGVSAGVAGVELNLVSEAIFQGGARVPDGRCDFEPRFSPVRSTEPTDRGVVRVQLISCFAMTDSGEILPVAPDSVYAKLLLTAYDSAYVRYADVFDRESAERDRISEGVTGALGVFAGAATAERRIIFLPVR